MTPAKIQKANTFRVLTLLGEEDVRILNAVMQDTGIARRATAIRFILRDYGRLKGLLPSSKVIGSPTNHLP